jgi:hypothetical protein
MSAPETIRLRHDATTWRLVDGEVIVLDRRNWDYLTVNDTGAVLWQRLAEGATAAQLVRELVATFDVEEERAHADVADFLGALRGRDLLDEGA